MQILLSPTLWSYAKKLSHLALRNAMRAAAASLDVACCCGLLVLLFELTPAGGAIERALQCSGVSQCLLHVGRVPLTHALLLVELARRVVRALVGLVLLFALFKHPLFADWQARTAEVFVSCCMCDHGYRFFARLAFVVGGAQHSGAKGARIALWVLAQAAGPSRLRGVQPLRWSLDAFVAVLKWAGATLAGFDAAAHATAMTFAACVLLAYAAVRALTVGSWLCGRARALHRVLAAADSDVCLAEPAVCHIGPSSASSDIARKLKISQAIESPPASSATPTGSPLLRRLLLCSDSVSRSLVRTHSPYPSFTLQLLVHTLRAASAGLRCQGARTFADV